MPRRAGPHSLPLLALLAALHGCASAPPPAPPRAGVAPDLAAYLVEPVDPADESRDAAVVRRLHRRLIDTGDAATVAAESRTLITQRPELSPQRILLAQALLVQGDARGAIEAIRAAGDARGVAAQLVEARALESLDELPEALVVYRKAAAASPTAARRAAAIEPRAVEILSSQIEAALERAQPAAAERALTLLETLRPHAEATLRLGRRVAAALGDPRRELAMVRSLTAAVPGDRELQLRRAQLEMEVGDAHVGLGLFQELATASPGDVRLADELWRARFLWRVANSPEPVRRAAASPQATRADLAVMLYWLVPQVRTARSGAPRIASDILEHPAQEAIVRVVNLGLLGVDETLHRFEPDRAARRHELHRALLRLLAAADPAGCASGEERAESGARRESICRSATACGLAPSEAECLPTAPLSGAEALEMVRRAVEILERG